MRKIASHTFKLGVKEKIALYTQEVLRLNFERSVKNTESILQNNVGYFNQQGLGETILKQSLVKGLFPRISYPRSQILKAVGPTVSEKMHVDAIKEKSDFRLIGEMITANHIASSSEIIEKITMNSGNPNKVKISTIHGNVNRDVILSLNHNNNIISIERDIKAGNNAVNPFSGVLASVPLTENLDNYRIINENYINLHHMQNVRKQQIVPFSVTDFTLEGFEQKTLKIYSNLYSIYSSRALPAQYDKDYYLNNNKK